MTKQLSRIGDVIYALTIVFLVAGFGYAGFSAISQFIGTTDLSRSLPTVAVAAALVVFLISGIALLEKALPLRGFTEMDWIYTYRPKGRWPMLTAGMILQIAVVLAVAGLLTYVVFSHINWAIILAAISATARAIVGLRGPNALSGLLDRGKRKQASLALVHLYDSEASSNALAAVWGRSPSAHAQSTTSQWRLGARRLVRRTYLGLAALVVVSVAILAAHLVGVMGLLVFALLWALLAQGVYRAVSLKSFEPFVRSSRVAEIGFLFAMAAVGAVVLTAVNGALLPALFYGAFLAIVIAVGYWRGQPRSAEFNFRYDPFSGSMIPVGVLSYFTCAWPAMIAGLALMVVAL